jgi:hypothetical protein
MIESDNPGSGSANAHASWINAVAMTSECAGLNYVYTRPVWLDIFTAASKRLQALPTGWDGPGSVPSSKVALYKAEQIARDALTDLPDALPPYLVPAGDGSVQVEWHGTIAEIELTVDPNGNLSFWSRDHTAGKVCEGEDGLARNLFLSWAPWAASPRRNAGDESISSTQGALQP